MRDGWHKVFCRNCGQELPEWAAFCDRCGAPVRAAGTSEDPIEHVEFVNGLAEPLWDEAEDPQAEVDATIDDAAEEHAEPRDKTEFMGFDLDPEGAGAGAQRELGPTANSTRHMSIADDETHLMTELEAQGEDGVEAEADRSERAAERHDEEPAADDLPDDEASRPDEEPTHEARSGEPRENDDEAAPGAPEDAQEQVAEAESEQDAEAEPPADDSTATPADGDEDEGPSPEDDDADEPRRDTNPSPDETPDEDLRGPYREPLKTIDVGMGMDQNWYENAQRYPRNRPADHRRAFEYDHVQDPGAPTIWVVIGIAAAAIAISLLVAHIFLSGNTSSGTGEEEVVITAKSVSKRDADKIIASLDGWWKTGRTFDGRYWHLQSGLMETYAADGKLAAQVLVDPASLERLDNGPGGIEGAGYYLRDVGYYLVDDDPDTLHAIAQDGQADEDANLLRTDPPSFVTEGTPDDTDSEPADVDEADRDEYMLPDAATRVYSNTELEAMSDHDLFVARNEIYARHGYVFETGELSEYFSSKSWYQPSDVFNEGEISEIERQNVSAILAIEQARGSQYV